MKNMVNGKRNVKGELQMKILGMPYQFLEESSSMDIARKKTFQRDYTGEIHAIRPSHLSP